MGTENNLSTTESITTTEDEVNDSVYVKHCASHILLHRSTSLYRQRTGSSSGVWPTELNIPSARRF